MPPNIIGISFSRFYVPPRSLDLLSRAIYMLGLFFAGKNDLTRPQGAHLLLQYRFYNIIDMNDQPTKSDSRTDICVEISQTFPELLVTATKSANQRSFE